ncbi:pentapeptide repeat-containing protein [Methylophaga pinxianii]|uniref:pentapeptide repeat-containing protein n=1 Tax=Methylophaga pinxianii TaxID=2881052 RepID=UPI001CF4390B|nr:pentapeptide repeat-containing protein [Methylophaga pinxianii]MCB2426072.1 pentapeptide repeat-containing protein [Methylophaga pinxianii]UPH45969.1 pentapeptide repeat-containing protein [Methylophaga pinxianii]
MGEPKITQDPLYQLLRDGKIEEFNHRIAKGEKVDLTSCDFRHLNLQGLIANGLDFSNSYFRQADLRGIDFSQCISLRGASIHGAKISGVFFPSPLTAEEITLSLQHGTRMRYSD